ncbi:hypothetical protein FB451DRAFT_1283439 [Mycena latifolia]|nr:hypothetical protein FB451DRAFT_1283439 [Mycena latifolia]
MTKEKTTPAAAAAKRTGGTQRQTTQRPVSPAASASTSASVSTLTSTLAPAVSASSKSTSNPARVPPTPTSPTMPAPPPTSPTTATLSSKLPRFLQTPAQCDHSKSLSVDGTRLPPAAHAAHACLLSWFFDAPAAPFGVHRMALGGEAAGKGVGMWFGPNAAAGTVKTLVDAFPACGLGVSVTTDGTLYQTKVFAALHFPGALLLATLRLALARAQARHEVLGRSTSSPPAGTPSRPRRG